jgi:hypothetical protein
VRLHLPLALLLVALFAPFAGAQGPLPTISDFEEPYVVERVTGAVVPFEVGAEEAGARWLVVFRSTPGNAFNLSVVADNGTAVYTERGSRGIRALPALAEGTYRFVISRDGAFQLTRDVLEGPGDRARTLGGGTDAYVASTTGGSPGKEVTFSGNVTIEAWDLVAQPEPLAPNATWRMPAGHAVVYTVRGAPGTPYTVGVVETAVEEPPADTPAVGALGASAAVAGASLVLRRRLR